MTVILFVLIAGGLTLALSGIRGTKPASNLLWGKDESGNSIKVRERISWGIIGVGLMILGAFQLFHSVIHRR